MAQNEVLEKKNLLLKRNISEMILRENKEGLSVQENLLMQKFIREYHGNCYQLNSGSSE